MAQKNTDITNTDVFKRIRSILMDTLGVHPSEVVPDANFTYDLGADSLDLQNLVLEFEKEFGVRMSDDEAEQVHTVGEAVKFIEQHLYSMSNKDNKKQDEPVKVGANKKKTNLKAASKKEETQIVEQIPEFTDTLHYMIITHYWSLPVLGSGKTNARRFVFRATNPECEDGIIFQTQGNPIFDEEAKLFSSCMNGDIIQVKKRVLHNAKVSPVSYSMVKNISADKRIADFNKNYKKIISKIENNQKQKTKE